MAATVGARRRKRRSTQGGRQWIERRRALGETEVTKHSDREKRERIQSEGGDLSPSDFAKAFRGTVGY
jgi:hypothetical protein